MNFLTLPEGDPRIGLSNLPAYALRVMANWAAGASLHLLKGTTEQGRGPKFFFQLAGHNRLWNRDAEIRPGPGDVGVVMRNTDHGECWVPDAQGLYLHLFLGVQADRISMNLAGLGGVCGLPGTGRIFASASVPFSECALVDHLLRFASGMQRPERDLCHTLASVLREGMRTRVDPGNSALVARAAERIRRQPCDPELSVKRLALELGCHPDYLSRRFAEEMGQPLMRFVRERRMEVAEDFLRGMRMPVAEIAALCGYHDHSYFTKVFRESRGITPLEYATAT